MLVDSNLNEIEKAFAKSKIPFDKVHIDIYEKYGDGFSFLLFMNGFYRTIVFNEECESVGKGDFVTKEEARKHLQSLGFNFAREVYFKRNN